MKHSSFARGLSHRLENRPASDTGPHRSAACPYGPVTSDTGLRLNLIPTLSSQQSPSISSCAFAQSPWAHPSRGCCALSVVSANLGGYRSHIPCSSLLHCGFFSQALGSALCLQTIPGFTKEPGATRMQPNLGQSFSGFKLYYSEVKYGVGMRLPPGGLEAPAPAADPPLTCWVILGKLLNLSA